MRRQMPLKAVLKRVPVATSILNTVPEGQVLVRAVTVEVLVAARSAGVSTDATHCIASRSAESINREPFKPSTLRQALVGHVVRSESTNRGTLSPTHSAGMLLKLTRLAQIRRTESP